MKKTYTTVLPDKVGAFLKASEIFCALGLNITRVSYNKAVDTHMLFIEAEGTEDALSLATEQLEKSGYLLTKMDAGSVLLLEFTLKDEPGQVLPILRLIDSYRFNISFISSQADGSLEQHFRMGLLVEDSARLAAFIRQASELCRVRVIDYDQSETVLDNTVFYLSFVNRIAEKLRLSGAQKLRLMIDSNLIMDRLIRSESPAYKTFDYIGRFADKMAAYHGDKYVCRVTEYTRLDAHITVIEPPVGSNITLIERGGRLLCVDSGFACYREESLTAIRRVIPDFDTREKELVITHADVDHCALMRDFDHVYMLKKCRTNFELERAAQDDFREENQLHAPYARISKILSSYEPPELGNARVIGGTDAPLTEPVTKICTLVLAGLTFDVYEGQGGHVAGETVLIERTLHLLFTGDIYVNVREFTKEQAAFNRIAPYLMTSVDTNPALSAKERQAILLLLSEGEWLLIGGHGKPLRMEWPMCKL